MSETLFVLPKWQRDFHQQGLVSFGDFFENNEIFELVAKEKSTSVFKFKINNSTFFLKRILPEHIKKVTRSILKGKGFWNPVADEVRNLEYLKKTELPVMDIVAWGINKTLGFPKASFIISEEVEGEDFMELYDKSNIKIKRLIYKEYGKLMAKAHNLSLDTLIRPQDLFFKISEDQKRLKPTLIDREEGSNQKVKYTEGKITKEIALIFYKFIKRYERLCISLRDVLNFCEAYLENSEIIKMQKKDFYELLLKTLVETMAKRKSQQFVKDLLPEKTFKNII